MESRVYDINKDTKEGSLYEFSTITWVENVLEDKK